MLSVYTLYFYITGFTKARCKLSVQVVSLKQCCLWKRQNAFWCDRFTKYASKHLTQSRCAATYLDVLRSHSRTDRSCEEETTWPLPHEYKDRIWSAHAIQFKVKENNNSAVRDRDVNRAARALCGFGKFHCVLGAPLYFKKLGTAPVPSRYFTSNDYFLQHKTRFRKLLSWSIVVAFGFFLRFSAACGRKYANTVGYNRSFFRQLACCSHFT